MQARKKIKVSIPAGIDNGQSVRIRDKGEPGVNGGPRGDLLVEVNVSAHPIVPDDRICIFSLLHPISFAVAALGRRCSYSYGRRRCDLYCKTGNKDGYKSPP